MSSSIPFSPFTAFKSKSKPSNKVSTNPTDPNLDDEGGTKSGKKKNAAFVVGSPKKGKEKGKGKEKAKEKEIEIEKNHGGEQSLEVSGGSSGVAAAGGSGEGMSGTNQDADQDKFGAQEMEQVMGTETMMTQGKDTTQDKGAVAPSVLPVVETQEQGEASSSISPKRRVPPPVPDDSTSKHLPPSPNLNLDTPATSQPLLAPIPLSTSPKTRSTRRASASASGHGAGNGLGLGLVDGRFETRDEGAGTDGGNVDGTGTGHEGGDGDGDDGNGKTLSLVESQQRQPNGVNGEEMVKEEVEASGSVSASASKQQEPSRKSSKSTSPSKSKTSPSQAQFGDSDLAVVRPLDTYVGKSMKHKFEKEKEWKWEIGGMGGRRSERRKSLKSGEGEGMENIGGKASTSTLAPSRSKTTRTTRAKGKGKKKANNEKGKATETETGSTKAKPKPKGKPEDKGGNKANPKSKSKSEWTERDLESELAGMDDDTTSGSDEDEHQGEPEEEEESSSDDEEAFLEMMAEAHPSTSKPQKPNKSEFRSLNLSASPTSNQKQNPKSPVFPFPTAASISASTSKSQAKPKAIPKSRPVVSVSTSVNMKKNKGREKEGEGEDMDIDEEDVGKSKGKGKQKREREGNNDEDEEADEDGIGSSRRPNKKMKKRRKEFEDEEEEVSRLISKTKSVKGFKGKGKEKEKERHRSRSKVESEKKNKLMNEKKKGKREIIELDDDSSSSSSESSSDEEEREREKERDIKSNVKDKDKVNVKSKATGKGKDKTKEKSKPKSKSKSKRGTIDIDSDSDSTSDSDSSQSSAQEDKDDDGEEKDDNDDNDEGDDGIGFTPPAHMNRTATRGRSRPHNRHHSSQSRPGSSKSQSHFSDHHRSLPADGEPQTAPTVQSGGERSPIFMKKGGFKSKSRPRKLKRYPSNTITGQRQDVMENRWNRGRWIIKPAVGVGRINGGNDGDSGDSAKVDGKKGKGKEKEVNEMMEYELMAQLTENEETENEETENEETEKEEPPPGPPSPPPPPHPPSLPNGIDPSSSSSPSHISDPSSSSSSTPRISHALDRLNPLPFGSSLPRSALQNSNADVASTSSKRSVSGSGVGSSKLRPPLPPASPGAFLYIEPPPSPTSPKTLSFNSPPTTSKSFNSLNQKTKENKKGIGKGGKDVENSKNLAFLAAWNSISNKKKKDSSFDKGVVRGSTTTASKTVVNAKGKSKGKGKETQSGTLKQLVLPPPPKPKPAPPKEPERPKFSRVGMGYPKGLVGLGCGADDREKCKGKGREDSVNGVNGVMTSTTIPSTSKRPIPSFQPQSISLLIRLLHLREFVVRFDFLPPEIQQRSYVSENQGGVGKGPSNADDRMIDFVEGWEGMGIREIVEEIEENKNGNEKVLGGNGKAEGSKQPNGVEGIQIETSEKGEGSKEGNNSSTTPQEQEEPEEYALDGWDGIGFWTEVGRELIGEIFENEVFEFDWEGEEEEDSLDKEKKGHDKEKEKTDKRNPKSNSSDTDAVTSSPQLDKDSTFQSLQRSRWSALLEWFEDYGDLPDHRRKKMPKYKQKRWGEEMWRLGREVWKIEREKDSRSDRRIEQERKEKKEKGDEREEKQMDVDDDTGATEGVGGENAESKLQDKNEKTLEAEPGKEPLVQGQSSTDPHETTQASRATEKDANDLESLTQPQVDLNQMDVDNIPEEVQAGGPKDNEKDKVQETNSDESEKPQPNSHSKLESHLRSRRSARLSKPQDSSEPDEGNSGDGDSEHGEDSTSSRRKAYHAPIQAVTVGGRSLRAGRGTSYGETPTKGSSNEAGKARRRRNRLGGDDDDADYKDCSHGGKVDGEDVELREKFGILEWLVERALRIEDGKVRKELKERTSSLGSQLFSIARSGEIGKQRIQLQKEWDAKKSDLEKKKPIKGKPAAALNPGKGSNVDAGADVPGEGSGRPENVGKKKGDGKKKQEPLAEGKEADEWRGEWKEAEMEWKDSLNELGIRFYLHQTHRRPRFSSIGTDYFGNSYYLLSLLEPSVGRYLGAKLGGLKKKQKKKELEEKKKEKERARKEQERKDAEAQGEPQTESASMDEGTDNQGIDEQDNKKIEEPVMMGFSVLVRKVETHISAKPSNEDNPSTVWIVEGQQEIRKLVRWIEWQYKLSSFHREIEPGLQKEETSGSVTPLLTDSENTFSSDHASLRTTQTNWSGGGASSKGSGALNESGSLLVGGLKNLVDFLDVLDKKLERMWEKEKEGSSAGAVKMDTRKRKRGRG